MCFDVAVDIGECVRETETHRDRFVVCLVADLGDHVVVIDDVVVEEHDRADRIGAVPPRACRSGPTMCTYGCRADNRTRHPATRARLPGVTDTGAAIAHSGTFTGNGRCSAAPARDGR